MHRQQGSKPFRGLLVVLVGVTALTASVSAFARPQRAERAPVWRVAQFSFRYSQTAKYGQACSEDTVSGTDVAGETAQLEIGKLKNVQRIDYQYTPGLTPKPGGPDSRGHSLLAVGHTVESKVTKDIVNCESGEHTTITCTEPERGPLIAYDTGAYSLWTNRKHAIVNVAFQVMGDDFENLLTCEADPGGGSLGAAFLEGATHDTYVVRTTVPLRTFAKPTTTITVSRTLSAPADAVARGFPTGTATVDARLVLRKGFITNMRCPARDPLFRC
jgi:hypothetical protein